jgi:signal transduction histidine kinase
MSPDIAPSLAAALVNAATMAAFVLATLAVLFIALHHREGEPGMAWIGAGFGCAAIWYGASHLHVATTAYLDTAPLRAWAALLTLAVMAVTTGVVDYLGAPRRKGAWLATMLAPCALLLAALAAGLEVQRGIANLATMVCYIGLAVLALRRSTDEPGAGHVALAIALLAVPVTFIVLLALHADPSEYRLFGVMPMLFFGITLLTVSLLRRRRALEEEIARRRVAEAALGDANHNLEATIAARTAELEELVAGLEGFNRSVSHDLRGPLGGIAGLARLASDAIAHGDLAMVQRSLQAIAAQADTSTKLITALLQLAHVGDAQLSRRAVKLDDLAREVVAQLRMGQAGANAAQWVIGRLPEVQADADLLRPVLVNLMGNAAKFARDAHPPIVQVDASVEAGDVTVHVRDNGVGFPPEAAPRLFQPFMRLHGPRFEGHGIGLSIVRRAVERHGGKVWADSQPEHGAAFHFTLPKAA